MKKKNPALVNLFQLMSDHTKGRCGTVCGTYNPNRCCDSMYCEITKQYAKEEYGIDLKETGHEILPFMGKDGCTVEPHLRPLCTLHDCKINSLGFEPKNPELTKRYFEIREQIEDAEG